VRAAALAGLVAALALAGTLATGAAGARLHRLHLPSPPAPPRALSVDEVSSNLVHSRSVVSAGVVRIAAYNRGMDDHDLVVIAPDGQRLAAAPLAPGASALLAPRLEPGDYRVICSLFAGTPASHELLGMRFVLHVR
jgi:hypothetical protein